MKVLGIIAEYDPFHKGHQFHLEEAKRLCGASYVICLISCAFKQRGIPALFSTHARAEMALQAGADLVLGLPYSFGTAQADRFALGGVSILDQLQVVTHLGFGVEETALPLLERATALSQKIDEERGALRPFLAKGQSVARAKGAFLAAELNPRDPTLLTAPNFNLALCYQKALRRTQSRILPLPIPRRGSYHADKLSPFPSATAARKAIASGDWRGVEQALPPSSYAIVQREVSKGHLHFANALDAVLLYRLLRLSPEEAALGPEISEGLENRILSLAPQAKSRESLIAAIKTKRYPYARISRALNHLLLGLDQAQCLKTPTYARLLGFRRSALPLLSQIGQSGFPLLDRPAKEMNPQTALDMRAEQLWCLGAKEPAANAYTRRVIIIEKEGRRP